MKESWPAPESSRAAAGPSYHRPEFVLADVGEPGALEPGPHPLDRVEVRGIGGQPLHGEPAAVALDPLLHLVGAMGLDRVPEEDDAASDVAPEVTQET